MTTWRKNWAMFISPNLGEFSEQKVVKLQDRTTLHHLPEKNDLTLSLGSP